MPRRATNPQMSLAHASRYRLWQVIPSNHTTVRPRAVLIPASSRQASAWLALRPQVQRQILRLVRALAADPDMCRRQDRSARQPRLEGLDG